MPDAKTKSGVSLGACRSPVLAGFQEHERVADRQSMNFGATSKNASGMSSIAIRGKALQAVEERSRSTSSGSRMKGKVGIITGVGPVSGIGVSLRLPFVLTRPDRAA